MKNLKSLDFCFFFIILISIFLKIFYLNIQYITWDELLNLNSYFYKEALFLRNYPNNHFFTSFIGIVVEFFVGTNLTILRASHFIFFLLLVFLTHITFKNKLFLYLLVFIYLLSDVLFVYSFLLRGYYISAFFFCIIFFKFVKNKDNPKLINLNLIFFICAMQLINNISSLYLVAPIIFAIFFNFKFFSFRKKIFKFILNFLFFFISIGSIQILLTGLYLENIPNTYEKITSILYSNNIGNILEFLSYLKNIFFDLYQNGIKTIYFSSHTNVNPASDLRNNLPIFLNQIKSNITIFSIFFISLIILVIRAIKNKLNIFDYTILYFFIFFILLNRNPSMRIYIPFTYYFMFYIFYNIKSINVKFKFLNYLILILSLLIVLFEKNIYRKEPPLIKQQIKIYKYLRCDLNNQIFEKEDTKTEFDFIERQMLYYLYLEKCKKKRNIKEYIKFF